MSVTAVAGMVLTGMGLVASLSAERARRRALLYIAKPTASVGFLLVAFGSGASDDAFGIWILVGLVLSLFGDVALMFMDRAAFLAGLASFLLAHIAYVGAFLKAGVSPKWTVIAAAGAVVVAAIVLRWLLPHVEDDMKVPVLGYVAVISVMASLAVGTLGAGLTALIVAGAVLFYISDLFVARDRFVSPGFVNTLAGLPLYYLAQVLLALSTGA
jgi:uncharacterized membrane protein YhhN